MSSIIKNNRKNLENNRHNRKNAEIKELGNRIIVKILSIIYRALVLVVYASHHMKTASTNATNDGATINSILAPYKIISKKIITCI